MNFSVETGLLRKTNGSLSGLDYGIITFTLILASFIGVYYGVIRQKMSNNLEEYFLGGRKMGIFPITMSLMASFYSAILMLGAPGEVYSQSGIMMISEGFGVSAGVILAGFTFLPLMFNKGLTTTFEVPTTSCFQGLFKPLTKRAISICPV